MPRTTPKHYEPRPEPPPPAPLHGRTELGAARDYLAGQGFVLAGVRRRWRWLGPVLRIEFRWDRWSVFIDLVEGGYRILQASRTADGGPARISTLHDAAQVTRPEDLLTDLRRVVENRGPADLTRNRSRS